MVSLVTALFSIQNQAFQTSHKWETNENEEFQSSIQTPEAYNWKWLVTVLINVIDYAQGSLHKVCVTVWDKLVIWKSQRPEWFWKT